LAAQREKRKSSKGGAGELLAEFSSDHELFVRDWKEFVKALNFFWICHKLDLKDKILG
jgi:hypothetical protein